MQLLYPFLNSHHSTAAAAQSDRNHDSDPHEDSQHTLRKCGPKEMLWGEKIKMLSDNGWLENMIEFMNKAIMNIHCK